MKKVFLLVLAVSILSLLVSCSAKALVYDSNYGIRFYIEEDDGSARVVSLCMDEGDEYISFMTIAADIEGEFDREALKAENPYDKDEINTEDIIAHYRYYDSGLEMIFIALNKDDFKVDEHPLLIEYLGLEDELSDGLLSLDEFMNSESFRYKEIIEEGNFDNNISFSGDSSYDFRGEIN